MTKRDKVYHRPQSDLVDFSFDERVAGVFPDMIRRSVPGYDTVIATLGVIGEQYWLPDSRVVDLGCSLGAATLSLHNRLGNQPLEYICVDNADAMLEQCKSNLSRMMPDCAVRYVCADIVEFSVEKASLVVLNFTLQFLPPESRQAVLNHLYSQLLPGGALVLSEKIKLPDDHPLNTLHLGFKAANGYSELEISQKRNALDNVMLLDDESAHLDRLQQAGFTHIYRWFQTLNFSSYVAVKSH